MKSNVIDLASRKKAPAKNTPDCRAAYFEMSVKVREAAKQLYMAIDELGQLAVASFDDIRPEAHELTQIGTDKICDAVDMIQEGLGILEDAITAQTKPLA